MACNCKCCCGACCDGASCTKTTPADCPSSSVFKGKGTECSPNPCEGNTPCTPTGTPCPLPKYCRCDEASRIYPPLQFGRTATYECAEYLQCNFGTSTPEYFPCCSSSYAGWWGGTSTQADCEDLGFAWSTQCVACTYQNIVKLRSDCPPAVSGVQTLGGDGPGCTTEVALYKYLTAAEYNNFDSTAAGYAAFAPIDPRAVADGGDVDYAYKLECLAPIDPSQIPCQCPLWETGPGLPPLPSDDSVWDLGHGGCFVTSDVMPAYKIVNGPYAGWYITVRYGLLVSGPNPVFP